MKPARFADTLGVSRSTVTFIESDERKPSRAFLEAISDRYNVSSDWLLHGSGDMLVPIKPGFRASNPAIGRIKPPDRTRPEPGDFAVSGTEYAMINCFSVRASAGRGAVVVNEDVIDRMAFSRRWLTNRGLSSDLCGLVRVDGNSMEPTIPHGSLILVGFAVTYPLKAGVYLFQLAGELLVKHLTPLDADAYGTPTRLLVTSDNRSHLPRDLAKEDLEGFRVLGRVVTVIYDV